MKRILKFLLKIFLLILFALLLIAAVIQLPPVQTRLVNYLMNTLSSRTGTTMHVERVGIRFPKSISMNGLYLEDLQGDTLLYAGKTLVNLRIMALFRNNLHVKSFALSDVSVNIKRAASDELFNYDFLIQAFSADDTDPKVTDSGAKPWTIRIDKVQLKRMAWLYEDAKEGISLAAGINNFVVLPNMILPDSGVYKISHLALDGGTLDVRKNGSIRDPKVFNPDNFSVANLALDASNIMYQADSLSIQLDNMAGVFSDAFTVKHLSAAISLDSSMRIQDLIFESDESFLSADVFADQAFAELASVTWDKQAIELSIPEARIGHDLLYFVSALDQLFGLERTHEKIHIGGLVHGSMDTLQIQDLHVSMPGIFRIQMTGILENMLTPEHASLLIDTLTLQAAPVRINTRWAVAFIPENFVMPDTLTANVAGIASLKQADVRLTMLTNTGNAQLTALYAHNGQEASAYDTMLKLNDWQAGKMLGLDALTDVVSAEIVIKGSGFELSDMDMQFTILLDEVTYNGYRYTAFGLDGAIEDGHLRLNGDYHDKMLHARMSGSFELLSDHQRLEALLSIHHINPLGLGLSQSPFMLKTQLSADIRLVRPDFFEGYVRLDSTSLTDHLRTYALDSMVLITGYDDGLFQVNLESGIAQFSYNGNVPPLSLGQVLGNHLNLYVELPFAVTEQAEGPHFFDMDVLVRSSDWFTQVLFPDLHVLKPIVFHAEFNSTTDMLFVEGTIPELHYDNIYATNFMLRSRSVPAQLDYHIGMDILELGGIEFVNPEIIGRLYDGKIDFSVAISDQEAAPWLKLSGELTTMNDQFNLVLDPDVLIHREAWHIVPDHAIRYGDQSLWVQDFKLSNQQTEVAAQSFYRNFSDTLEMPASSLALSFQAFDLGRFSGDGSLPEVAGVLNGSVELHQLFTGLTFTSDLTIDQFGINKDTIGDISLQVESPGAEKYLLRATIDNYGNQATLNGLYQAGAEPAVDLDILLTRFDLSSIKGFVDTSVDDLQGQLTGNLKVKGNPAAPDFNGRLHFSETSGLARLPNIRFSLRDESLRFDRNSIHFDSFSIRDGMGRVASLNGRIILTDFNNPRFDLGLTSRNFLAMNVLPGQNELFHGRVLFSSDLRLSGDLVRPSVEGNLTLNEGSSLELKVPQSAPDAIGDAGIVVFLHPDSLFVSDEAFVKRPDPYMTAFNNLLVNVNIEIDPLTDVRILIDEYAGDFIEVKGGGLISYGTDPGGRISLTGRYELAEGTYLLTFYDVIRRQFLIRSGSSMTWTGDPQNPFVDIRAAYAIRTSARELFGSPAAGSQQIDQRLRQSFPFQVFLTMKGSLLNPEIRFEIALAPGHQDALDGQLQARLRELNQNESELNKQVFALLMVGGFVPDNPLDAGFEGPGLSSAARSSASKLLSQQLNRLSEQHIRGINIRFDIESYEDFTTGEARGQTQLNLEVSKNFFDERLKLTVGGNIEVEDETKRETNAGDIAGDFALEYLLNPKGTLILKGFRRKEFRDIFEGQLIETGISLKFNKSYNEFRELLRKVNGERGTVNGER